MLFCLPSIEIEGLHPICRAVSEGQSQRTYLRRWLSVDLGDQKCGVLRRVTGAACTKAPKGRGVCVLRVWPVRLNSQKEGMGRLGLSSGMAARSEHKTGQGVGVGDCKTAEGGEQGRGC